RIVEEIELRQDEHRAGAAVPRGRQVPLETPRIEVSVEPGDDEDGVDVRRQDVLLDPEPGGLAGDLRATREDRLDRVALAARVAAGDPVADGGHAREDLLVA